MQRPALLDPSSARLEGETQRRWVWIQRWFDMLFLHWRVPSDNLQQHLADDLEIDEHDGDAWVSLVLFRLRVRPAWLPFVPGFSNLFEVNLRTYVRYRGQAGICFLSVHAHNRLAMFLARLLTPMPYEWAGMKYQQQGENYRFDGESRCTGACPAAFRLSLTFRPCSVAEETIDGSLGAWLLERYRLFIDDGRDRIRCAAVDHPRWIVRPVEVAVVANTAGDRFGLDLARPPDLAHFSDGVQARFGAFA